MYKIGLYKKLKNFSTKIKAKYIYNDKYFSNFSNKELKINIKIFNYKTNKQDIVIINKENLEIAFIDQVWKSLSNDQKYHIIYSLCNRICKENHMPNLENIKLETYPDNSAGFINGVLSIGDSFIKNNGIFCYEAIYHELKHYYDELFIANKISAKPCYYAYNLKEIKQQIIDKIYTGVCSVFTLPDNLYDEFEDMQLEFYYRSPMEFNAYMAGRYKAAKLINNKELKNYINSNDKKYISELKNRIKKLKQLKEKDNEFKKFEQLWLKFRFNWSDNSKSINEKKEYSKLITQKIQHEYEEIYTYKLLKQTQNNLTYQDYLNLDLNTKKQIKLKFKQELDYNVRWWRDSVYDVFCKTE